MDIRSVTKYLVILVLFWSVRSEAQTWNLVWSDEFNGGTINAANWTYDIGGGGWGNSELEYYTNRPDNATTNNGNLLVIAKSESYNGSSYTSARMKTLGLQSFTYGRIEARMKLPVGQGLWPAFWMLGSSITQVGWPKCGEIDIMEHIDNVPQVNGTMHWDNNGHVQSGGAVSCNVSQYHVYSIEWNADSIKWFVDGAKYFGGTIANNVNSTDEFHAPAFILLNLAVGGSWPGNPDGTTLFPDTMYVDYVRVYQLATGVVSEGGGDVRDHYALNQNYPNPFNPETVMSYDIPVTSKISLSIYDVLGRKVATLVDQIQKAGSHQVAWNASGYPSGVYFFRLTSDGQAGTFTAAKKLLLVK